MKKETPRNASGKAKTTPDKPAKPAKSAAKKPAAAPAKPKKETLEEKTKRVALELISQLPSELRAQASKVTILVKKRPGPDMDEFLMGVFEGPTLEEMGEGGYNIPPRITLFSQNIWEESEDDPQAFEEEVRVTLYHELGHFLGLDEDELEERGLG